jgi:hypothetical protein
VRSTREERRAGGVCRRLAAQVREPRSGEQVRAGGAGTSAVPVEQHAAGGAGASSASGVGACRRAPWGVIWHGRCRRDVTRAKDARGSGMRGWS